MTGTMYFIAFLISIVCLLVITGISRQQDCKYYILMFTTVIFVNMGYWIVATAESIDVAAVGIKLGYFDGTLAGPILFLCFLQICNIKIKPFLINIICGIGLFFQILVMSIGKSDIFYKNISLGNEAGVSYIIKEYGPAHSAYLIFLVLFMVAPLVVILYSVMHRNKISYKYTIMLGLIEFITVAVYFAEKLAGVKYELLPFALVADEILLILIVARIGKYDISRTVTSSRLGNNEVGYVIFDMERNFVGCDENAKMFFPEFKRLDIDRKVEDPYIKEEFVDWLDACVSRTKEPKIYTKGDKTYRFMVRDFDGNYGSKQIGHIIEITDDTSAQNHINELGRINAELEVAAAEARNANMAKNKFLANMSHEIRTPINAMLGMNEMISREATQDSIISYSEDIKDAGATLIGLINELIELSKIESGKADLVLVPYDLSSLIRDVIAVGNVRAADKGLEFRIEVDENTPKLIYGDEIRIKQVITNLINGAIKYTESGYVGLKVGFDKISEEEIGLKIELSDSGVGVKKTELEEIKASFSKDAVERNSSVATEEWGFSVCKEYLALMDAEVFFDSVYGMGTSLAFVVRQKVENWEKVGTLQEITYKKQTVAAGYVPKFKAPDARILAVDDTFINLKVVKALLKQTECTVDLAKSGDEAIKMCDETKYDLILLDHMMPGLDGIETLEILRNGEGINRQTPVIALTANAVSGVREMYIEKGFDDYIPKPIKPLDLEKTIVKYLPGTLVDES